MAEYLAQMTATPYAEDFTASLAVMGRSGTLRSRGRREGTAGLVLGKTGTHLTPKSEGYPRGMRSSALSEYCLAEPEGAPVVAFSVMQERPESKAAAKDLEDQVAALLSRWAVS
ncbi:D-alanyl-D-alanine carboxypeptidase [Nesterenkonia ebinurensis]|uniref:D-alanyl-D-alanine carboxypeptidase n=1 Tax=Nesterenkonia ebinurensis TaxID=2608252 RepID=UPI0021E04CC3|nr:D-alanyl-D-alanine carboxypeptidase [Nesterenkonia ebinurensis]